MIRYQLFLVWAALPLVMTLLMPSIGIADNKSWISGYGSVALTNDQTLSQCKAAALQAAKANIFSKAGLEKFSSEQFEICSDTLEATHCELHQQTLNYYEGAFIKNIRNKDVRNTAEECTASIEAVVKTYGGKHDPTFGLDANINGSRIKRNGEVVQVVGELTKKAYLALFVWSPSSSGDRYQLIFPNKFESKNQLDGKFRIPSSKKSKTYSFFAEFPKDQNGRAVNEWLFLLATKSKFEVLELESSENFHRRLDELGRENWRLEKIGYTILTE